MLECRLAEQPSAFTEVPGATRFLAYLIAHDWHVCIATGGWSYSAKLKCRAASIPESIPLFSSDRYFSREAIVAAALQGTRQLHGVRRYNRTVCLGDGVWDVVTAANLALPFIGVAEGGRARRLRLAGAAITIPDFTNLELAMSQLAIAPIPRRGASGSVA